MKRTDFENKDGCDHRTIEQCRNMWCWLTSVLSTSCFWETHSKCGGRTFDPKSGKKHDCACHCHQTKPTKYLSPFTNTWV